MEATFISSTQFRSNGYHTSKFVSGREIKANYGVNGLVYGAVQSSSFSTPNTNVTITDWSLTSNLLEVFYGIIADSSQVSL